MPSLSEKGLLNLIGSLYEAAQTPSADGWKAMVESLRRSVVSDGGCLSFQMPSGGRYQLLAGSFDASIADEYNDCYHSKSPFSRRIQQLKDGEGINRADVISDASFLDSDFYQEYLRRYDVFHYEYHQLFRDQDASAGIGFTRPRGSKNFGSKEKTLIRMLVPHISRSVRIFIRTSAYGRDLDLLRTCFERMSEGTMVVDDQGRVVLANAAAEAVMARGDGIRTDSKNLLEAFVPAETKRLRSLVSGVFDNDFSNGSGEGTVLSVTRAAGRSPLSVTVVPIAESDAMFIQSRRYALVIINDPELEINDVGPLLRRVYRLTPAESRIATLIARGHSVREICELLEISENTIRTHLKRVFAKTETKRQSELVKLVMTNSARMV